MCDGTESRLIDCTYDSHTADCSHLEDAGVQCECKQNQFTTIVSVTVSKTNKFANLML